MTLSPLPRRSLVAGALALLAVAGLSDRSRAADLSATPITIGVGVDAAYSPMFLADQEGLFKKAGVNVTLQQFTQGGDALDALVAGQVQVSGGAEPTTLIRMSRSNLRALAVYGQSGSYIKLVARAGINDIKDLKKLGIVPGSVSEYSTQRLLSKYDMPASSVQLVKAGPPEMPALLVRGDIDGYFLWEPWPALGVKQGGKILATSGDVGYVYNMWLTVPAAWLDTHKPEAQAMLSALSQACSEIRADPNKAATATQAEAKIPAAQTLEMLKGVDCVVRDFTPADLKSYAAIQDFLVEKKIIPAPLDLGKFIMTGFYKG